MLWGIGSVASFITVNEQSESNPDCSYHSSDAFFASGRSYHQSLLISTVAGVKCLCGGRKKSPHSSSLVQLSIFAGLPVHLIQISVLSNENRCIRQLYTA